MSDQRVSEFEYRSNGGPIHIGDQWVIEFDYRSDGGPDRVGPFPTKQDAEEWSKTLLGPDWSASLWYTLLTPPERGGGQ